jgi:predicted transglutaminase-like cysteine proteinase
VPRTDMEMHGVEEYWSYPDLEGDCEDYVLLKRLMLMERGFSASDLLITVVRKADGEGHAVLTLRTSKGDYVLDNLSDEVQLWSETSYVFLKRQASFHTGRWVSIENSTDVLVGALQ